VSPLARLLAVLALSFGVAAPAPAQQGLTGLSMGALDAARARIQSLRTDLAGAPEEARRLGASARASLMSGTGVRAVTYLAILLLVGIGVEWLYWTYAYAPLRAVQAVRARSPGEALRLALRRYGLLLSGLALFGLATIGASAAFSWPAGVHELVVGATLLLLALRLGWLTVGVVVAPGRPHLQLVPVDPAKARWLAAAAIAIACLLALGYFVPQVLERTAQARHVAGAIRLAAVSAAALLLVVAAFAFFGRSATDGGAARARSIPRSFLLALVVVAVYAVWLLSPGAAPISAILGIVLALQLALRPLVFFFWQDEAGGDSGALPSIVLAAARFVVLLLGVGACVIALDTPLATLAASESPVLQTGLRLVGVATLALLTHVVWIGVRTAIDRRLAEVTPSDPHAPPDPSARLLTLLPVARVTTAVVLLTLLILSSLWALGIEITPLLAGAGVVGLALGFGAQALVRDVISGIFYLAEDAFRVGEYIESGSNIKGRVERITVRSVALRHHNGPLHFVPYGSLGAVRNASRDWVVDKFNLPLPIDVESEKIRKLIKKVGDDLMQDAAIGPLLIEPLKGKLYRVDPGVKIFRCKFRCPPGKQFDVRAQALRRIEAALKEMGVPFADLRLVPPAGKA